jgi:response regulator RpfG family c-di-GMP phosphodiesterase|tara:strand:+ start:49 stop:375 length:327 start_codon:yes stop_codon:yes gene_type:complete
MASAKNYTEEMVAQMTEQYTANPTRDTVDNLAREFGKTTRSIIAKLSREGVYVAQPRTTKTGEPIVSKAELVSEVATILGVEVDDIASLEKATKIHLKALVDRLSVIS